MILWHPACDGNSAGCRADCLLAGAHSHRGCSTKLQWSLLRKIICRLWRIAQPFDQTLPCHGYKNTSSLCWMYKYQCCSRLPGLWCILV